MKNREDLARGWWRKGDSDLENARMCVEAERSLDTACFHAQRAAEKYLKAYLSLRQVDFPLLHNLAALVEICKGEDDSFGQVRPSAESLTPYAVEARYDEDFWPDLETARIAVRRATEIREFIAARIPAAISKTPSGRPTNTTAY
jgi:HEPN domain-containing protein